MRENFQGFFVVENIQGNPNFFSLLQSKVVRWNVFHISKDFGARVFIGVHDAEMSYYAPVAEVIYCDILKACKLASFQRSLTQGFPTKGR